MYALALHGTNKPIRYHSITYFIDASGRVLVVDALAPRRLRFWSSTQTHTLPNNVELSSTDILALHGAPVTIKSDCRTPTLDQGM